MMLTTEWGSSCLKEGDRIPKEWPALRYGEPLFPDGV